MPQGLGISRPHSRQANRVGGELSIDIAGPFEKGVFPTDQPIGKVGKYFLVGAFVPLSSREAAENQAVAEGYMRAQEIQGPVDLETTIDDEKGRCITQKF